MSSIFLDRGEASKVQRGCERFRLFCATLIGFLPGVFGLAMNFINNQSSDWWSYLDCMTLPMLWIAGVFGVSQALFLSINWVINGFAERTFSRAYKKKGVRQAVLLIGIPLMLSMLCAGLSTYFKPKFDWSQFEQVN